jgi:hypothetical protein
VETRTPGILSKSEAAVLLMGYLESVAKLRPTVTAAEAFRDAVDWLARDRGYEWEEMDPLSF